MSFNNSQAMNEQLLSYLGKEVGDYAIKTCSPASKRKLLDFIIKRTPESLSQKQLFHEFVESTEQTIPVASRYSVLIDDVSEEDFTEIGTELGIERLSVAQQPIALPISGIFWNNCSHRMFLPLTVQPLLTSLWPHLNVLFLVDLGSPHTYLRRDTFDSLFPDTTRNVARVLINGLMKPINVSVSFGLFDNIDLLGQDFLILAEYTLTIEYGAKTLVLTEKT